MCLGEKLRNQEVVIFAVSCCHRFIIPKLFTTPVACSLVLIWAQIDCYAVQLFSASSVRIWTWLEYLYVVVLLGLLTQGPVLKIWEASGQLDSNIIDITKFATYLVVQIPALILLSHRGIPSSLLRGPAGVLLAFCGWMLISTVWATLSSYSLIESVSLFVTCLAGLYIARSFTLFQQLSLFLVAMQPGLLVSYYAIHHNWSNAVNFEENYWIGIYFNRNSLAPPAVLGLLAALALLWIVILRQPRFWLSISIVLVSFVIFDSLLLLQSKSSTSLGAGLVFVATWGFWTIIRSAKRKNYLVANQTLQKIYFGFLIGCSLLILAVFRFQKFFLALIGRELDFNGREILWGVSFAGFSEKPLLGWGWMSAWHTPNFFKIPTAHMLTEFGYQWSHSGIMDVLLGGGVIGAGLLAVAIIWGGSRQLSQVCTQTAGQWTFAATWFVIAASTQESFIVGNHFLWLLLVASMAGSRNETMEV